MYCQLNLFLAKELPGSESSCRRQLALVAGLTGKRLSDGKSLDEEACWEVGWSAMDRFAASHPRPLKHCSERKGCGVIIGREEGREVEGMWFFASGYTRAMLDEAQFRRECDRALESLKQALIAAEDDSGSFEFEDNNGVMNIIFENGSSKFVVTPNTPDLDLGAGDQLQTGVVGAGGRLRFAEDGRGADSADRAAVAGASRG
jgi:hypothetical protein